MPAQVLGKGQTGANQFLNTAEGLLRKNGIWWREARPGNSVGFGEMEARANISDLQRNPHSAT
jgi:hypothetical protein